MQVVVDSNGSQRKMSNEGSLREDLQYLAQKIGIVLPSMKDKKDEKGESEPQLLDVLEQRFEDLRIKERETSRSSRIFDDELMLRVCCLLCVCVCVKMFVKNCV